MGSVSALGHEETNGTAAAVPAPSQYLICGGTCGRCLLRYDPAALVPGKRISVYCRECKTVTEITGHPLGIVGTTVSPKTSAGARRIGA